MKRFSRDVAYTCTCGLPLCICSNRKTRTCVYYLVHVRIFLCCTVSSMLLGLGTRSLGLNTFSSLVPVCPSQSYVYRFLGLTSTKHEVNVTCSRPQRTATRSGLEPGTPWSIVRDANHCASPPPEITMKLCHACEELVSIAKRSIFRVYRIIVMHTHEC